MSGCESTTLKFLTHSSTIFVTSQVSVKLCNAHYRCKKDLQTYKLGIPEGHNEKCNDNLDLSQFLGGFITANTSQPMHVDMHQRHKPHTENLLLALSVFILFTPCIFISSHIFYQQISYFFITPYNFFYNKIYCFINFIKFFIVKEVWFNKKCVICC